MRYQVSLVLVAWIISWKSFKMVIHFWGTVYLYNFFFFCGPPFVFRDKYSSLFGPNSVFWWKLDWPVPECRPWRWYMEAVCCSDMAPFSAVTKKKNAEVAGKLSMLTVNRLRGSAYCLLSGFASIGFSGFEYDRRATEVKNQGFPSLRWTSFLGIRALSARCSWLWSASCPPSPILLLEATGSINFSS